MSSSEQAGSAARPAAAPSLAVATGAFAFPLLASLVNLLKFYDYPIAAAELWPLYLGLTVLGLVIGAVHLISHRLIRVLIEAGYAALIADINTDGMQWIAVAAGVVFVIGLLSRSSLVRPLAFGGFVLLALCVVGVGDTKAKPGKPIAQTTTTRPLLLHIILDEHGGVAGMPAENPATPARRAELTDLYVREGFRLYGAAYSQHMRTTSAVPQILNFGATQPIREDNRGGGLTVRTDAYFEGLKRLGYVLRVYESSWVDLCAFDAAISCVRHREAGLTGLRRAALSASDKRALILTKLAARSTFGYKYQRIHRQYVVPAAHRLGIGLKPPSLVNTQLTSSLQSLETADALIADLAQGRPGQAYVAHLLLPHYPYVARADCSLKPRSEWLYRRFGGTLRLREDAAYEQTLCAARKVREAIAAIERSPAGRNYVVVLHGDHGSRLTVRDPLAGVTSPTLQRDIIAAHATLFAIKGPSVAPGYVATPARVDDLLAGFARGGFAAAPAPAEGDHVIFLEDGKWRPVERTHMPHGWAQ